MSAVFAAIEWSEIWPQVMRFWSLQDGAVRTAVAGVILLGISCGTLGCFIVLRRMSLMGDSLGHAVLPGVCLGFLVTKTKNPLWIFVGAVLTALAGSWLIGVIHRRSRIKPDTAMGLVLSGFFGLGIVLLTRLQNFPYGNQSGLNQFLFGQASAINERDLWLIGSVAVAIVGCAALAFKELTLASFDEGFAAAAGLPVGALHYLLMGLTAFAIVISIQAVGVVLLSAMLITPAVTALLLTNRLKTAVILAVILGTVAGLVGLNISFLERQLPTGPFIVVALSVFFTAAWLFSPREGIVTRAWRRRKQSLRTRRENLLKSVHHAASTGAAIEGRITWTQLASECGESEAHLRKAIKPLVRQGWVETSGDGIRLTDCGEERARELDRTYRLWELFLTHEVNLPVDHTQRDAEDIEHILGPELVRALETKYEAELAVRN